MYQNNWDVHLKYLSFMQMYGDCCFEVGFVIIRVISYTSFAIFSNFILIWKNCWIKDGLFF